jgi:hypothetical protein
MPNLQKLGRQVGKYVETLGAYFIFASLSLLSLLLPRSPRSPRAVTVKIVYSSCFVCHLLATSGFVQKV